MDYLCQGCGETYNCPDDWTAADKREEFEHNYPGEPYEDIASLCDDCYDEFMIWFKATQL